MYLELGQPTAVALNVPLTRVWINELPPFGNVCRIVARLYGTNRISVGTGFLVGRYHVLSAAHVIFPPAVSNPRSITIYQGQNDTTDPPGIKADAWAIHPEYSRRNPCAGNRDFGIIRLSKPAPSHFDLVDFDIARLKDQPVTLAGYPESKSEAARLMFRSEGALVGVVPDADCAGGFSYHHSAASEPSMSGGPLWTMIDGVRTVVGLHRGPIDRRDGAGVVHREGRAVILSGPVREQIARWIRYYRPLP